MTAKASVSSSKGRITVPASTAAISKMAKNVLLFSMVFVGALVFVVLSSTPNEVTPQPRPVRPLTSSHQPLIEVPKEERKETSSSSSVKQRAAGGRLLHDYDTTSQRNETRMAEFKATMAVRRDLIRNHCDKKVKTPRKSVNGVLFPISTPVWRRVIYMRSRNILWCPVFKASTSTWLNYLLDIAPDLSEKEKAARRAKDGNQPLKLLDKIAKIGIAKADYKNFLAHYGSEKKSVENLALISDKNSASKSFIIVRHPFARMISAYRDKIERYHTNSYSNDWYFKVYGSKMVKQNRKKALARFGPDFFSAANNFGTPVRVKDDKRVKELPCFWEFVQFVIVTQPSRMDEHWRPTYEYCDPCSVHYDNIIHFENLAEESDFLKSILDPDRSTDIDSKEHWVNPNPNRLNETELIQTYFAQLDRADVSKLYQIYQQDFQLFGFKYEPEKYRTFERSKGVINRL